VTTTVTGDAVPARCLDDPAAAEVITGTCAVCLTDLTCDGYGWTDPDGDAECPGGRQMCERGCYGPLPGRPHLADPPCGLCGSTGFVAGLHDPVPDYRPTSRQDGGPR